MESGMTREPRGGQRPAPDPDMDTFGPGLICIPGAVFCVCLGVPMWVTAVVGGWGALSAYKVYKLCRPSQDGGKPTPS